jgi:integrase
LLAATTGTTGLMIRLMYGTGMRLMECLQLRVKEVDFERNSILIRAGKGNKDRTVMLPERLKDPLQAHVARLKELFALDREADVPGVWLPDALSVKYPNAGKEWGWHHEARRLPHTQAQLCDAPSGIRRGHPYRSGSAWTQLCRNDANLYSRDAEARDGGEKSAGYALNLGQS